MFCATYEAIYDHMATFNTFYAQNGQGATIPNLQDEWKEYIRTALDSAVERSLTAFDVMYEKRRYVKSRIEFPSHSTELIELTHNIQIAQLPATSVLYFGWHGGITNIGTGVRLDYQKRVRTWVLLECKFRHRCQVSHALGIISSIYKHHQGLFKDLSILNIKTLASALSTNEKTAASHLGWYIIYFKLAREYYKVCA